MKILLSGGLKTKNIVNGVSRKFQSSGDEFIVVEFIDDIANIFTKGDYYDKAIITEQSINREYSIKDEYEIRRRINQFANECAARGNKQTYVFLTQSEEIANCIYEEILPIQRNSVVVYKKPSYSVGFFYELIVTDVNQLPSDWVYKPADIEYTDANEVQGDDPFGFDIKDESNLGTPTPLIDPSVLVSDTGWGNENNDNYGNNVSGVPDWVDSGNSDDINAEIPVDGIPVPDYSEEQQGAWAPDNQGQEQWAPDNQGQEQWAPDNQGQDWGGNQQSSWVDNTQGDVEFNTEVKEQQPMNTGDWAPNNQGQEQWQTEQTIDNNGFNPDSQQNNWEDANQGQQGGWTPDNQQQNFGNQGEIPGWDVEGDTNIDDINPIKQSGELPNYARDAALMGAGAALSAGAAKIASSIPGFDDEDHGHPQKTPAEQMYDGFTPGNNEFIPNEQYSPNHGDGVGNFDGFDTNQMFNPGDYGDTGNQQVNPMFTPDGYGNNNEQQVNPNFSNDDYVQNNNPITDGKVNPAIAAGGINLGGGANNQNTGTSGKVKGIKGFLGRQNNGNQQVVNQNQYNNQAQQAAIPSGRAGKVNIDALKNKLKPFATRGNSIAVTGCGGCGTSTIAYSLANILNQLGYTVLLVDMDTEHKAQSYISRMCYDSIEHDSANLMAAINSTNGIGNYTSVVKTGFHLLTMGLASDSNPVQELIHKEKISRFMNVARTNYNFVIYDIPFKSAVGYLSEMVHMSDNVALVIDSSNWGITKTLINMCNIPSDEMQDSMFNRAQIVFNKYRGLHKVFDRKIKTGSDITRLMDEKVFELIGEDIGLHFDDMHIAGIVNDTTAYEDGWFSDVHYSDTHDGQQTYLSLAENIILNG